MALGNGNDNGTTRADEVLQVLHPKQVIHLDSGHRMVICDLDKGKADYLLSRLHPQQRGVRKHHAARIAQAMESGKYVFTGDPYHIDRSGLLINGQHRCHGVSRSNVAHRNAVVVLEMAPDAIVHLDTESATRSAVDALRICAGVSLSSSILAAVAIEAADFRWSERIKWTKADVAELAKDCEYRNELSRLRTFAVNSKVGTPSGVLAAALRCLKRDREDAYTFYSCVLQNDHVINGKPLEALRLLSTAVLSAKQKNNNHSVTLELIEKCIKAWNAYRTGQDIRLLRATGTIPVAL